MNVQDVYSVFVTNHLNRTKDFYINWFKFEVVFESSFFVLLTSAGEKKYSIAFIDEVHPTSPPDPAPLNSKAGVFLTLQVADAKGEFEKLKKAGADISYQLKDEPWGQRRFGIIDPNGLYIDVVEQINPQEGFWDKYM